MKNNGFKVMRETLFCFGRLGKATLRSNLQNRPDRWKVLYTGFSGWGERHQGVQSLKGKNSG